MPWRRDYVRCFWLDPDWTGLSGYPTEDEIAAADLEALLPRKVERTYPTYKPTIPPTRPMDGVVIVMRDRIGFEYERYVGLDQFVSIREGAQLLELPVMTVSRWVKKREMKSKKRRGFTVIRLREVLRAAQRRGLRLKLGSRLVVVS